MEDDEGYCEEEFDHSQAEDLEEDRMYGEEDDEYEERYNRHFRDEENKRVSKRITQREDLEEGEYEFDEITGGRDKKPILSALNKTKLSKYEMDDLFNEV